MKKFRVRSGAASICLLLALCLSSCEQPAGRTPAIPDTDAALQSLAISAGNLLPPFNPETTSYTAMVGHGITSIAVTAAPVGKATVSGDGDQPPLQVGPNLPIIITVRAEDGKTAKTYTVTVTRLDGSVIEIDTAEELAKIGRDKDYPLAGSYFLASDLELENWTPIGENGDNAFTGEFNGNGEEIFIKSFAGGVFDAEGDLFIGLFGYVKGAEIAKALVKDLNIQIDLDKRISKTAACYVGAIAGYADEHTELDTITVEGSLHFSNANTDRPKRPVYVGGIAGALIASELKNSVVRADIAGFGTAGNGAYSYVGGLVGIFDRNAVNPGLNPTVIAGVPFAGASISNCRSAGNVSGSTEGSQTNVFAGGIAGGSRYGMKTYYSGKIEDCSSTGNVTASGGGYWSWAGGIAGTICGDGHDDPDAEGNGLPATGPTRIVRCYATGVITGSGPQGSWPYTGGIVGNNYYGGLVSQCRFDGTVRAEGEGISDYTGGIAGYNSKQYYGHGSRIEDCWSAGEVEGYLDAGGIAGQNQVAAVTERCYSTALVSVRAEKDATGSQAQRGAGGIAGYNAITDGKAPGTVRNCVALNPSIVSSGGFDLLSRIVGNGDGDHSNNLARADMEVAIGGGPSASNDKGANGKDGADINLPLAQSVFAGLGWDFDRVWKMDGGYPVLQWQE
jgi:hypothetical protein